MVGKVIKLRLSSNKTVQSIRLKLYGNKIVQFVKSKLYSNEIVLFSPNKPWHERLIYHLNGFQYVFSDLNTRNYKRYDYFIPLSVNSQLEINKNKKLHKVFNKIIPSSKCINLCDNKDLFRMFLKENGFYFNSVQCASELPFPYVFKLKRGEYGAGVYIIKTEDDEKEIRNLNHDLYFKEEFIPGKTEYASHIFIQDGEIKFLKTIEYSYSSDFFIKGPNFTPEKRLEVDHSYYFSFFSELLIKMNYSGICCINYKIYDKKLKVLEVNPRFGGSCIRFINDLLKVYPKTKNL
jgi:predicted ATP-grasp superfamily ATP-dependent carboligase